MPRRFESPPDSEDEGDANVANDTTEQPKDVDESADKPVTHDRAGSEAAKPVIAQTTTEGGSDGDDSDAELLVELTPPDVDPAKFDFGIEIPEYRPHKPLNLAESPSRLCIKAIITENFKSFYGKKFLGPFDQKFTAIVGPNGCGKSNTIDALLFVFGFPSRRLRAQKLQELIHVSGSHPECRSASVSVYFAMVQRPTDNQPPVPNCAVEFSITRMVRRSGESVYYVDKNKATRVDVVDRLKEYGVDLDHNRFLILQGEVEQISMMKPTAKSEHEEGMLEYLEDIIGSNRYKEPITKFEEEIARLNDEIEKSDSVQHTLRRDMNGMRSEKKKAEKYLQEEGNASRLEHILLQVRIHTLRNGLNELMEEIATRTKDIQEKREELSALKAKEKSWLDGQSAVNKQLKELRVSEDAAVKEHQRLETEKTKIGQELSARRKAATRLEDELRNLRHDIDELKQKIEEDGETLEQKKEAETSLDEKITEESANFAAAQEQVASVVGKYRKQKEELDQSKRAVEQELHASNLQLDGKQNELNLVRSEAIAAEKRVTDITSRLDAANNIVNQMDEQIRLDQTRLQDVKRELADVTTKSAAISAKKATIQSNLSKNRESLNALQMVQQRESQARSRDHAINDLMQCKRNNSIPGILGRLGDLGAVDKKYEVAVSAIGGRSLDMVVVDTVQTSKACIERLKASGKGRASIMVLEQIRKRISVNAMDGRTEYPEGCPRLIDLIRLEDQSVKPAFYYILRDCLASENLDQATRVANRGHTRHKVVTLRGEVIDTSGAMTGGGSASDIDVRIGQQVVAHASPSSARNQNEINALEEAARLLNTELSEVVQEFNDASVRIPSLQREESDLTSRLRVNSRQLEINKTLSKSLPNELSHAEAALSDCRVDARKENELNEAIEELQQTISEIESRRDELTQKIADIDSQIWEKRGEKVKESESKLKKYRRKLAETKAEITRLTSAVSTNERAIVSKQGQIGRKETQFADATAKVAALETDQKESEQRMSAAAEVLVNVRNELRDAQRSFEHMKAKMEGVQEEVEALQNEMNSMEAELKEHEKAANSAQKRLEEMEPKMAGIVEYCNGREFAKPVEFKTLTAEEIGEQDKDELKTEIAEVKKRLEGMQVNLTILKDHAAAKKKVDEHFTIHMELKQRHHAATSLHKELCERRKNEFMRSFDLIRKKLKETYHMLTCGGDAELEICNQLKLFSEGIDFNVRPPNKSWKSISNLSGGEKTLSSLSLIFALHHYKPTPFYIMDEIDAALDYRNVTIAGNYVKNRAFDAQFIIVSLRPNMYQQAARHLGIFKIDDSTQISMLSSDAYKNLTVRPTGTERKYQKRHRNGREKEVDHASAMFDQIVASLFDLSMETATAAQSGPKRTAAAAGIDADN
ncbi:structural maintenance of chromosomes protein 4-like [Paramacrobiotus metropolitanus]|uniref:structural maintenance of chromosomes protein 4-like n=1 Tax=Paramacrobiotus metropolitanus TaxID=2943436 RepID=UPI002445A142|nr:structural maintenance of chromosomes protein 4-like [Paramacrobiotus metropolitanus]XP_055347020.1 structural maintenance of chromosomes protein 4-like [Paramacrobiotus metropolitanus]